MKDNQVQEQAKELLQSFEIQINTILCTADPNSLFETAASVVP